MKGKHQVIIGNNKITYDITLERQITVIKGKSGSGKSTLFQMFENIVKNGRNRDLGYKCNCTDKIRIIENNYKIENIKEEHNKIFIADEYCEFIQTKEFAEAIQHSDNYYIFITRSGRMNWLTYSINDIYELKTDRDENGKSITKLYSKYLNKSSYRLNPDLVITEDSNSGHEMFSKVFKEYDVVSAYGRDNVYNVLNTQKFKCAYMIVDGAAFGSCIGRIIPKFNNVFIFAPESFEYLLLKTNAFKRYLKDELDNTSEYCDSVDFISWEKYYTNLLSGLCKEKYDISYSKKKLNEFFKTEYYIKQIKNFIKFMYYYMQ